MCTTFFWGGGAKQPPNGPGSPHSRGFYITQNDPSQSIGLLWTSYQLDPQRPIPAQHTTLSTDRLPCPTPVIAEHTVSGGEQP
jgi:hypothetical protein